MVNLQLDAIRLLGVVFTVSPDSDFGLWQSMIGFVTGSGLEETVVNTTQFWSFGGYEVDTISTFSVTAFGEEPQIPVLVPEPATVLLVTSSAVALA